MEDVSPPRQQRSKETLGAIASATRRLLLTQSFSELTIQSIVSEANSSAGSFYARFKGKRALLHYLHEDFAQTSLEEMQAFVVAEKIDTVTVEHLAELLIPELVRSHVENRGILRAALIESLDDPVFTERAAKFVASIAELIADHTVRTASRRDRHVSNVARTLLAIIAILDQTLFFAKSSPPRISSSEIARLRRIFVASLCPDDG